VTALKLPSATGGSSSPGGRALRLFTSEWTKLRSVRSTFWTLLITAVTALGGSVILAFSSASDGKTPFDQVASIYLAWLEYPVLAIGILGLLAFTSEFSTGQIRTTLTAVPRRLAVLAAKAGVVGALALVSGELLSFAAFFLSEGILSRHHRGIALTQPGALRAAVSAGVSLFAIALVGVALGAIIRHTAGAVAALPALIYLPLVALSLPVPWNERIGRFTMLMASYQLVSLHPRAGFFSPILSMLVLLAWPGVGLAVAAFLINRDA
jgi:ABC-2 type transport system permease protein